MDMLENMRAKASSAFAQLTHGRADGRESARGERELRARNTLAFKGGSYSLVLSAVVLAILVGINVIATSLPTSWTQYDISASKLYSVTAATKTAVNALDEDVTIYWIVQADEENSVIENLLDKYDQLSDHITVVKKNPDTYPNFAEQYTDSTVQNNSLVVECGDRSRYIDYNSIYVTSVNYTTYSYEYSFDGEGAITSAIAYVTSDDFPQLYVLEGHGEQELPDSFVNQLEKANYEYTSLSLLSEGGVPEDADGVIVYGPETDISDEEKTLLAEYVSGGGKLLMMVGPTENGTLENLASLVGAYGVTVEDGIVVEGDSNHYAFRMPYVLLPDIASTDVTESLANSGYYIVMGEAQGATVGNTGEATVTELLTTSDNSYSKLDGYAITTYQKEEGDVDGPFALAVSIEDESGGGIVWIGSSAFLGDVYNSYSSDANLEFATNALTSLVDEGESTAIPSKSLGSEYLSISETDASTLKLVMLGVLPLACVAAGIVTLVRRKRGRK
ncbi:MAG: Gldg family protein [Eggerthellaceae bacterium]|nr:Gldg family protein [Eggerthellaceae bacterium]